MLHSGSFYAGDSRDNGGTSASIEQRLQRGAADVLKKHQNKTSTLTIGRLPDPRVMAEVRSGLEDESSEAEMVCTHCVFLYALQLNLAMFSHIAGSRTKYGITVALMPPADAMILCSSRPERRGDEHK